MNTFKTREVATNQILGTKDVSRNPTYNASVWMEDLRVRLREAGKLKKEAEILIESGLVVYFELIYQWQYLK